MLDARVCSRHASSRPTPRVCAGAGVGALLAAVLLAGGAVGAVPADGQGRASPGGAAAEDSSERDTVLVEDFEQSRPGRFPDGWAFVTQGGGSRSYEESRDSGEQVVVRAADGGRFVRLTTRGEVLRYTKRNGDDFEWNIERHPRLAWRWRALALPEGASETGENDTGGAIYVTFGTDWLGRPLSIKYTYSSSLPTGTTVSFGTLQVVVVSSAAEDAPGRWKTVRRNVRADYRRLFGEPPPSHTVAITLWSDSDTTGGRATVDIDDLRLLPPRR